MSILLFLSCSHMFEAWLAQPLPPTIDLILWTMNKNSTEHMTKTIGLVSIHTSHWITIHWYYAILIQSACRTKQLLFFRILITLRTFIVCPTKDQQCSAKQ